VSRAKAVILGGEKVDAETGLAWGLWNRVAEDCRAEARTWAVEIAGRGIDVQRFAKELFDADESAAGLAGERIVQSVLDGSREGK
jgi:enoyl-CoA hydratase/carnithine racemase